MESDPSGVDVSSENIETLIQKNAVLISRPSSTIYQALMAGRQPFLFLTGAETLYEFSAPMGAFPTAQTKGALQRQLRDWVDGTSTYASKRFLSYHVSIDPKQPAALRIARALAHVSTLRNSDHR